MTTVQAILGDWDISNDPDCTYNGSGCLPDAQVIDVEVSCWNFYITECMALKVHKREKYFGSDFELFTIF